ncbi:2-halobenzoate 1,2-dioxygenase large subunit [Pigmentiphaga humi]|uniref:2-halobenzoate 1,2-dioxygenase large subunit n=1 Tax=Pigmentiphaga humi TaxID=2478468 RepID=A0A3P4B3N0_9BURK|nr:Rieske 2Fe-2S domain-containing protein [Pigmentiphaga humi]VCU70904.1 2-halobenzoate 1,2-dioxygenase large subunit [Pigmentiphaga humi]
MNETVRSPVDIEALIDDRPEDGVFRVHRDVYTSPDVFQLEMAEFFEKGWVFVGLASELPRPNDYKTVAISRYPLLLTRDDAGELHCFINSCRHRGMVLVPHQNGNQRYHSCRYHGWVFDSAGRCAELTQKEEGCYPPALNPRLADLQPVARFANYRGFLFASLSPDVPELEAHLGDAKKFLDLTLDKGADGMEFVPGATRYTFRANWKLQIENALDIYHFGYTHASYIDLLARRATDKLKGQASAEEKDIQGSFGFRGGHAVQWRENARVTPTLLERRKASYSRALDEVGTRWAGYGVNVTIFPNLQIVENVSSLILRVIRPLRADLTEMEVRCLAPVGEDPDLREARIRDYEDFFGAGGFATPDDSVVYELSQRGLEAAQADWTLGYLRGMDRSRLPATNPYEQELGIVSEDWTLGPRTVGDESRFHGTYRAWRERLGRGPRDARADAPQGRHRAGTASASQAPGRSPPAAVSAGWHTVASLADLAPGRPRRVHVGTLAIALVRQGDEIHAISDRCSHGAGSLSEGRVDGREIECPFHGGRFDLSSGAPTSAPCTKPVKRWPARIDDGRVQILLDETSPAEDSGMLPLRVTRRYMAAAAILALEFEHAQGAPLPGFSAGAHLDLMLPSGLARSYSLCNDPADPSVYRIAVQLAKPSLGGSEEVHAALHENVRIATSMPVNDFELDEHAPASLLIAGGIGVTPLMAMAYRLQALGRRFELHYACRSRDCMAFLPELQARLGPALHLHPGDEAGCRLDLEALLEGASRDSAIYVCGPDRLISAVEATARKLGWPDGRVRKETFGAVPGAAGPRPASLP